MLHYKGQLVVLDHPCLLLNLRQGLLYVTAKMAFKLQLNLSLSPLTAGAPGLQMHASVIDVGSDELNSGPHACVTNPLPTEPSTL